MQIKKGGEFKPTVLDFSDEGALTKALCCIRPFIYRFVINGIECLIYADDSGVYDVDSIVTMLVKEDGITTHMLIKNLFICKFSHGHAESLSDEECESILGNLRVTSFGYCTSRYLLVNY